MKTFGRIEIEEEFDHDDEICIEHTNSGNYVYFNKEELVFLRDHIDVLLKEDK